MALTRPLHRSILRWTGIRAGALLSVLLLLAVGVAGVGMQSQASAATSNYLNFQARLQNNAGAIVPDGNYHIEFKIYNASSSTGSSQGSCTGDANCLWTETRTTGNLVRVANGYLTVNLGSVNSLPTNIDWSQQLWLTMRVGGTAGSPSWDPEMSPRLQLTATPYAFSAGKLATTNGSFTSTLSIAAPTGGSQTFTIPDQGAAGSYTLLTTASAASGFIQNGTSPQTANYNITGNGTIGGNLTVSGNVNGNTFTSDTLTFSNAAAASNVNAATGQGLNLTGNGATTLSTTSGSLTLSAPAGQTISVGATNNNAITLGATTATSTITIGRSTASNSISIGGGNTATGNTQTIGIGNGTPAGTGNTQITVGNTANNSSVTANAGTGNINLNTVNTAGGTIVKSATSNSTAALQVQNASGNEILTVDTTNSVAKLGKASSVAGKLMLYNATNANTITLQPGTTTSSYTLTLPTALGAMGNCLMDTNGSGVLGWGNCGGLGGSGVTAVGTIDSQTKNANGAVISGTTIYMQTADGSNPGLVSTGTQAFAGAKTFNGAVVAGTTLNVTGNLTANGNSLFQTTTNSASAFQIQNSAGTPIVMVDTTNTNYITNPSFEANTTGWAATGSTAVSQNISGTNSYIGNGSLQGITTAAANDGLRVSTFTASPTFGTSANWNFSFYLKTSVAMTATLQAGYNIGAGDVTCTLTSTTTVTTGFTRFSCPITLTSGQTIASLFVRQSDATIRTMYLDAAQLTPTASAQTYQNGAIQLNGVVTSPLTLQSASNSLTALQVNDNTGTTILRVDTLNGLVNVGGNLSIAGTQVISSGRAVSNLTGLTQASGATSLTNNLFTNTSSGSSTFRTSTNNSAALQVQNSNNTALFGVDTTVSASNLVINPGFEVNTTGWANKGTGALTRITSPSSALYYGSSAGQLVTGTAANNGAFYNAALTLGTTYNLSFYARASTGTATGINFGYTNTGGDQDCAVSQSIGSSGFTRFSCSFTVTGTAGTAIYLKQTGTTTQTIYLDGFQLLAGATSATPYALGTLQLRGTVNTSLALQNTNDSTTAFQIQNAAGNSNLFVADTLNGRIGIGTSTPGANYKLDIQGGSLNVSGNYYINGTIGASITCSGGNLLQNATTVGGIVTGGSCVAAGVGGVTSVGAISGTSNANGATITGSVLNLTPADATNGGVLTNTTQSILGAKTFVTSVTSPTINATTGVQTNGTLRLDNTGNLSNIGTYAGSGNITSTGGLLSIQGTGTNSLTGSLSVGGTMSLNNSYPMYSWTTPGGTDLNWKTIANVNIGTGTGQLVRMDVEVYDGGCIDGTCNSSYMAREHYYVSIVRSYGTQDDTVAASLAGAYNNFVRVVKTSSSAYELQVSQSWNNSPVMFKAQAHYISSNATISYVNSPANGSTGTIYQVNTNGLDNFGSIHATGFVESFGSMFVKNDNTYALGVQNSAGNAVFGVDSIAKTIYLNNIDAYSTSVAPGAISRTSRVNVMSNPGFAPYVGSSFTPSGTFSPVAGTVLIATVGVLKDASSGGNLNSAGTDLTISGGGLTWVPIAGAARQAQTTTYGIGARSFYAIVGSTPPSNMQVTVGASGFNIYRYNVAVDEYTNVDQSTPVVGGVAATRMSANNNTFSSTLGATPVAGDYKVGFATMDEDFVPTGFAVPSGWTQIYDIGPVMSGDGPESIVHYQTGVTTTNVDFAISNTADQSPTAATAYGGFIVKRSTSSTTTGQINIGATNATDITMKASSTFQVQNSAGVNVFSIDLPNKIVKLGGALQGTTVVDERTNVNSSNTYTVSGTALGYYLSANSGNNNTSTTTTFNITGLSDTEGTVAMLSVRAIKGTTSGSRTTTTIVNINGSYVVTEVTNNTTNSDTSISAMQVMRINGAWRIIGFNNLDSDTADLAEWVHYTGGEPQPGHLLAVGDEKVNGSVKKTSGVYDNTLVGIVTTNPAQTFGSNRDSHSVRMALTGRVPAQVSTENGPIEAGDYLTASSIPGVAMKATKAGRMVGTALTSYNGGGIGTVLVQVQPGYAIPAYGAASLYDNGSTGSTAPQGAGTVQGDQLLGNRVDQLTTEVANLSDKLQGLQSNLDGLGTNLNTGTIQASKLATTSDVSVGGKLEVTGLAKLTGLELGGHLTTKGDAPTVELLPAAGTGTNAKVTVAGNDITGVLTIIVGDNATAENLLKMSFNKEYAAPPQVVLTPVGKGSAGLQPYVDQPSSKDFMLGVTNQPQTGQTYRFNYQILQ